MAIPTAREAIEQTRSAFTAKKPTYTAELQAALAKTEDRVTRLIQSASKGGFTVISFSIPSFPKPPHNHQLRWEVREHMFITLGSLGYDVVRDSDFKLVVRWPA